MGARETLEMLSAQMEIERLRTQLARVTKQRDEAWHMVELAYQEAIGECEDYADERLWEQSASKAALDAAREAQP